MIRINSMDVAPFKLNQDMGGLRRDYVRGMNEHAYLNVSLRHSEHFARGLSSRLVSVLMVVSICSNRDRCAGSEDTSSPAAGLLTIPPAKDAECAATCWSCIVWIKHKS